MLRYHGSMHLPKLANSSWFIVHSVRKKTINHQPLTINRNSTGFTLIELLVVISIIAILMAVATVSYTNAQQKGRDNRRKTDLKAVQQAVEIYFNQNGKYPSTGGTGQIQCNVTGDTGNRNWGSEFYCDPTGTPDPPKITYMNPLPKDPTNNPAYYYDSSSPNSSYKLYAKLENSSDPDVATAPTSCNTSAPPGYIVTGTLNYCVINP